MCSLPSGLHTRDTRSLDSLGGARGGGGLALAGTVAGPPCPCESLLFLAKPSSRWARLHADALCPVSPVPTSVAGPDAPGWHFPAYTSTPVALGKLARRGRKSATSGTEDALTVIC